jgi:hypothetical protein
MIPESYKIGVEIRNPQLMYRDVTSVVPLNTLAYREFEKA